MERDLNQLANEYDTAYSRAHYFDHRASTETPFIKALVGRARLKKGASILDAGCGQGFFTWLFAELGFEAVGVDISKQGILSAEREYGSSGATFEVGNIGSLPSAYYQRFDCVFARGLSLYNSEEFETNQAITESLLRYIKPGGVFVFIWYTSIDPAKRSSSLIYHSMTSVKKHFARYPSTQTFFSLRIALSILGRFAFSTPITMIDSFISRSTGRGGYVVALVPKGP